MKRPAVLRIGCAYPTEKLWRPDACRASGSVTLQPYHPAAALYGTSKSDLEEDFKKLGEVVDGLDSIKVTRQATLEFG